MSNVCHDPMPCWTAPTQKSNRLNGDLPKQGSKTNCSVLMQSQCSPIRWSLVAAFTDGGDGKAESSLAESKKIHLSWRRMSSPRSSFYSTRLGLGLVLGLLVEKIKFIPCSLVESEWVSQAVHCEDFQNAMLWDYWHRELERHVISTAQIYGTFRYLIIWFRDLKRLVL